MKNWYTIDLFTDHFELFCVSLLIVLLSYKQTKKFWICVWMVHEIKDMRTVYHMT